MHCLPPKLWTVVAFKIFPLPKFAFASSFMATVANAGHGQVMVSLPVFFLTCNCSFAYLQADAWEGRRSKGWKRVHFFFFGIRVHFSSGARALWMRPISQAVSLMDSFVGFSELFSLKTSASNHPN